MDSTGLKLTDKDMLNVAIRYIEQLLTSKGQHMSGGQIYDLLRKTATKHLYGTADSETLISRLMDNIKTKGE